MIETTIELAIELTIYVISSNHWCCFLCAAPLHKLHETGMNANVISFSVAISVCEKGWLWQHASTLLRKMCRSGMTAHVISFSTNISVFNGPGAKPSASSRSMSKARCKSSNSILCSCLEHM